MTQLRIGITGATGFIGKQLMDGFIAEGHAVSVLTRSPEKLALQDNIAVYSTDLAKPKQAVLTAFVKNLDLLYHLAGELSNPDSMQAVNVEGTRALLKQLDYSKTRFVYLSSIGIFDPLNKIFTENSPKAPLNTYEKSKLEAECALENEEKKGLKAVILRPSIVLGINMNSSLLDQLFFLIRLGIDLKLDEKVTAKVVLADDLVRALILLGKSKNIDGKRYNFSNDLPLCTLLTQLKVASNSRIIFSLSSRLFQFGLHLLRRLRILSISSEGVLFFSSESRVSSEKIINELGFEFTKDYGPFLLEYVNFRS